VVLLFGMGGRFVGCFFLRGRTARQIAQAHTELQDVCGDVMKCIGCRWSLSEKPIKTQNIRCSAQCIYQRVGVKA